MSRIGKRIRRFFRRSSATARGQGPGAARAVAADPEYCEYARYLYSPRRMIMSNFVAGLARGVGMALGFSLLGALVAYLLQQLASRNLPLIGDFIAQIIAVVESGK